LVKVERRVNRVRAQGKEKNNVEKIRTGKQKKMQGSMTCGGERTTPAVWEIKSRSHRQGGKWRAAGLVVQENFLRGN